VEQYIRILRQGCRCVEIDCWDGPDGEPMVTHGYTMTSKISFQEVIEACKDHGFTQSKFPLILSLEVHCSNQQKCRMAQILTSTLKHRLLRHPFQGYESQELISPKKAKRKFLVKAKLVAQGLESWDDDDGDDDHLNGAGRQMKVGRQHGDGPFQCYCGVTFKPKIKTTETSDPARVHSDLTTQICSPDAQCDDCRHAQHQLKLAKSVWQSSLRAKRQNRKLRKGFEEKATSKSGGGFVKRLAQMCRCGSKTNGTARRNNDSLSSVTSLYTPSCQSGKPKKAGKLCFRRKKSKSKDSEIAEGLAAYNHCIYLVGKKAHKFPEKKCPCEIVSVVDGKACKTIQERGKELPEHHRRNLTRIYPSGLNVNSANYRPMVHWVSGAQLVALNYQTPDIGVLLNKALFTIYNSGCGYVLKPDCVCPEKGQKAFTEKNPIHIWLRVISGHLLPHPEETIAGDMIDPWVSVKVWGVRKDQAVFETKMIEDNGFDPEWNEEFDFNVWEPDVAIVSFEVFDKNLAGSGLVAAAAFPVSLMRSGVRWVPLLDSKLNPAHDAGLLVHISITDFNGVRRGVHEPPSPRTSLVRPGSQSASVPGADEGGH